MSPLLSLGRIWRSGRCKPSGLEGKAEDWEGKASMSSPPVRRSCWNGFTHWSAVPMPGKCALWTTGPLAPPTSICSSVHLWETELRHPPSSFRALTSSSQKWPSIFCSLRQKRKGNIWATSTAPNLCRMSSNGWSKNSTIVVHARGLPSLSLTTSTGLDGLARVLHMVYAVHWTSTACLEATSEVTTAAKATTSAEVIIMAESTTMGAAYGRGESRTDRILREIPGGFQESWSGSSSSSCGMPEGPGFPPLPAGLRDSLSLMQSIIGK